MLLLLLVVFVIPPSLTLEMTLSGDVLRLLLLPLPLPLL